MPQPPTEGLLGALQPNATFVWRSAPGFNEWHMREHCLTLPRVLRANALQHLRYAQALPRHALLDNTQAGCHLRKRLAWVGRSMAYHMYGSATWLPGRGWG